MYENVFTMAYQIFLKMFLYPKISNSYYLPIFKNQDISNTNPDFLFLLESERSGKTVVPLLSGDNWLKQKWLFPVTRATTLFAAVVATPYCAPTILPTDVTGFWRP